METAFEHYRIVADSAADLPVVTKIPFVSVPLKIITAHQEYVDTPALDVQTMVDDLQRYEGKVTSSCPNAAEWLSAFGDARFVFCVAITSGLSGSYQAACVAKEMYESAYPGRFVFVLDSLSAGPEETLLVEKLEELILSGKSYPEICGGIMEYQNRTGLVFMLESLKNLVNNGRVKPMVAKLAGYLGIRIVGKASREGLLEPVGKCRGLGNSLDAIVKHLSNTGFQKGRVIIAHCFNEAGAYALKQKLLDKFQNASIVIRNARGLCSFYAEKGGLLVGYERI